MKLTIEATPEEINELLSLLTNHSFIDVDKVIAYFKNFDDFTHDVTTFGAVKIKSE